MGLIEKHKYIHDQVYIYDENTWGSGLFMLRSDGVFLSEKSLQTSQETSNVKFESGDKIVITVDTTENTIKFTH